MFAYPNILFGYHYAWKIFSMSDLLNWPTLDL